MRLFLLPIAPLLATVMGLAQADVLSLPDSAGTTDTQAAVSKPRKGDTVQQVVREFGKPTLKHAAVGGGHPRQPPITRWDYPGFSVFFEHGHVVDAVIPDQPPAVHHPEELQSNVH